MNRILFIAFFIIFISLPVHAWAHGFIQDGHNAPLRAIDYIELGGIALGSIGMIVYSFDQWRKDKKK
jgi:hypothetical protein